MRPLPASSLALFARLLRLMGALVLIAAGSGVALTLAGSGEAAGGALRLAIKLGGAALAAAALLFLFLSSRSGANQDPS